MDTRATQSCESRQSGARCRRPGPHCIDDSGAGPFPDGGLAGGPGAGVGRWVGFLPPGPSPDYNAAVRTEQLIETLGAAPAPVDELVRGAPADRIRR